MVRLIWAGQISLGWSWKGIGVDEGWNSRRRCHLFGNSHHPSRSKQGMRVSPYPFFQDQAEGSSIVEFANEEDARKAKAELADRPFMGRSVFIREVSYILHYAARAD